MTTTQLVFRDDPYDCAATVVAVAPEGGIVLDRTVFYAQGGGQPGDVGTLTRPDGAAVAVANTVYGPDRATILHPPPRHSGSKSCRREETLGEGSPRSIVGQPNQRIPITHQPAQYIFDVDSAVLAAHLTGTLAAEYKLHALSAGPTYLTGDTPITTDPALACFEITELLPFRTRKLAEHLRTRNIGQLEIKKRGVDIAPETLRRNLKLRGDNAASLLLTNIAGRPTAILAKRV